MLQWMNALPASPRVASAVEYLWPISFNRIYRFINVLCGTFTIDISMLVTSSMSSTVSVSCIVYPRGVNCCVYIFHILIWYQDFLHLFCHFSYPLFGSLCHGHQWRRWTGCLWLAYLLLLRSPHLTILFLTPLERILSHDILLGVQYNSLSYVSPSLINPIFTCFVVKSGFLEMMMYAVLVTCAGLYAMAV